MLTVILLEVIKYFFLFRDHIIISNFVYNISRLIKSISVSLNSKIMAKTRSRKIDNSKQLSVPEETEKENIYSRLRKRVKRKFEDTIPELKTVLSPEIHESNSKPLTFWGKKLKDLESDHHQVSNMKKHSLYEFTGTDESEPSYTAKKKCKQKSKAQPKKKTKACVKKKTEKHVPALQPSNKNRLNRKKEDKLPVKSEKFTFSSVTPLLGITSTPATCKLNTIEASSFMFLSPVTKVENPLFSNENVENVNNCNDPQFKTPQKAPPKKKRILRSRKIAL